MKTAIDLEQYADVFGGKYQKQISDQPKTGLIRVIDYFGANISNRYKVIDHDADLHYFTANGEHLPDFKHKVKQRSKNWRVDNSYEVVERNPDGTPNLDADGEKQKHPAFDYFIEIIYGMPAPLSNIIQLSIDLDDAHKLFD